MKLHFSPPFFSLTYCLCFLTNTAECLSLVHTGEGIITKSLNSLVLELSWRDINSGIIECTFYYALKHSCWQWLETFIFLKIHSTNVTATVSNCDISSFRMLMITRDKSQISLSGGEYSLCVFNVAVLFMKIMWLYDSENCSRRDEPIKCVHWHLSNWKMSRQVLSESPHPKLFHLTLTGMTVFALLATVVPCPPTRSLCC